MIRGHDFARKALERELPPAVLLKGAPHIGKTTLAWHLLRHHNVHRVDTIAPRKLTADTAREVVKHMATAPLGSTKAAILDLDGATPEALNAILKLLEEPPSYARFILTTSSATLLTVESRCHVYRLGLLTDSDVRDVLIAKKGMAIEQATRAAALGGGRLDRALDYQLIEQRKATVLTALKAVADGNEDLLSHALIGKDEGSRNWTRDEWDLLVTWAKENVTGRYRVFSREEGFGLQRDVRVTSRILATSSLGIRPRLAASHALGPLLASRK